MNYFFLREAQEEFFEAALRYESEEPDLGLRFRREVEHVIHRIITDPHLWRELEGGYRRVNCPAFPYYVAYFIRSETVVIAATVGVTGRCSFTCSILPLAAWGSYHRLQRPACASL